jgi:PAS domain S-box-containing protein
MTELKTSPRFSVGICGLHEPLCSDLAIIVNLLRGEVKAAADAAQLEEWFRTQAVDAVLIDDELLASNEALQACVSRAAIPTIVFTYQLERTEQALTFGAADVFSYKLNRDLLARRIENNIIAYRARRQMSTYRGRFEALYDLAPVMMHVISETGLLLRVNQAWLQTLGYRAEDVEGRPYAELLTDDLRADFPACLADVFAQGYARDVRTRLIAADGTVHHLIVDYNIFLDTSGECVAVSMLRDVTDIQRSEERLRESNRLYQAVFEEANDGILLVDSETRQIIEANPAASRLLGYTQEELVGRDIALLEENNDFLWMFNKRPQGRQTALDDLTLRRKDGTRVPVEAHSRLIQLDGRSAILAILRNTTARHLLLQKEKSTRLLAETLRDSADAFIRANTVQDVLDTAIAMVRRVVPGLAANVTQLQDNFVRMLRWIGYDQAGFRDEDLAAVRINIVDAQHYTEMATSRQAVYLPDVAQAGWPNANVVTGGWVRSYVGVPLMQGDRVYGFLNVDSPTPHAFTSEHVESIEVFAHQARTHRRRAHRRARPSQSFAAHVHQRAAHHTRDPLPRAQPAPEDHQQRQRHDLRERSSGTLHPRQPGHPHCLGREQRRGGHRAHRRGFLRRTIRSAPPRD